MTGAGADIRIVGGGIAGLALARAIGLGGGRPVILEQAPEISEVGAGLQISPNGLRVLEALGLGDALRECSIKAEAVELIDGLTGRRVLRMDLRDHAYHFVHRARLIETLHQGAQGAGAEIRLGQRFEPTDYGNTGTLIGADGVRSVVRTAINGPETPFFTGQVAWRAVITDEPSAPATAQVFMGPGRHLVSYPLAGGLRNLVAVEERSEWAAEGWNHTDRPDNLRRAFSGFPDVQDWLARVETVHLWGLFRHPVARHWHKGNMAILGDAAHPTLPFLAQGANMALEDAWVLADVLKNAVSHTEAFQTYQARRRDRVTRVIAAANANARNYHLGGVFRFAAHAALRFSGLVLPEAPMRRLGWIYDHDVTRE